MSSYNSDYSNEHLLIDIIQHYPFIYDKSNRNYKDIQKKSNAWESIAAALQISVEESQRQWRLIREKYTKIRRMKQKKTYQSMAFMAKHIATRKRISNVGKLETSKAWDTLHQMYPKPDEDQVSKIPDLENESEDETQLSQCEIMSPILGKADTTGPTKHSVPTKSLDDTFSESESILLSKEKKLKLSVPENPMKKNVSKQTTEVEDTLTTLTTLLKEKQRPDKNLAFGQYVGLSLAEMPMKEQNKKKIQIVEILNQPFMETNE